MITCLNTFKSRLDAFLEKTVLPNQLTHFGRRVIKVNAGACELSYTDWLGPHPWLCFKPFGCGVQGHDLVEGCQSWGRMVGLCLDSMIFKIFST